MKNMFVSTLILSAAITLSACGSSTPAVEAGAETTPTTSAVSAPPSEPADDATRLWIKPELVDCQGEAPQKCMQIAESEDGESEYFYDQIEGFTFVEGTSYVIDVRIDNVENPPADGSSLAYTLLKVVDESS